MPAVNCRNLLTIADWLPDEGVARVTHRVGSWETYGHEENGSLLLYPEEALFLLELVMQSNYLCNQTQYFYAALHFRVNWSSDMVALQSASSRLTKFFSKKGTAQWKSTKSMLT